jgi:hypothetical protein
MKRFLLLLLLVLLSLLPLRAQDEAFLTYNYQGEDYPIYDVPGEDGTRHQWALVNKGRQSSEFIDPANPDAGLIEWRGNWRSLSQVYQLSGPEIVPSSMLIDVQEPYPELFDNLPLESAVLSPDGSTVAGIETEGLCLYTFVNVQKTCFNYPDEFNGTPKTIYWSSDGKKIAFTENIFIFLEESDIWILDLITGGYTNLTNDLVDGSIGGEVEISDQFSLDYLPTWHPNNKDLYFIRSKILSGSDHFSANLYRLSIESGELTDIADLSTIAAATPLSYFSDAIMIGPALHGIMTISPDGTTIAILVRNFASLPVINENTGIWLIDLADPSAPKLLINQSELQSGMPQYKQDIILMPTGIAWAAEGKGLLVIGSNSQHAALQPASIAYYVDVQSAIAIPILDFGSSIKEEFGTSIEAPYGFGLSSDSNTVFMISGTPYFSISTLELPPTGSRPEYIYVNEDLPLHMGPVRFSTTGMDGTMLVEGFLIRIQ